jgi:D-lactate dehydrogenase
MNTTFYELTAPEKQWVKRKYPKLNSKFLSGSLSVKNLPSASIEILSIHTADIVNEKVLQKLPNLKLIVSRTAGLDHIDLAACRSRKISVVNCPGLNATAVAEFVFGLLLNFYRQIPASLEIGKHLDFRASDFIGTELAGKTIGIIGTGAIGAHVAQIAKGFGMNLIGFDAFKNQDLAKETGLKYVTLMQLVKQSDIMTLHVPAIPSTNKMISAKLLAGFKTGSLLVNASRGAVVDTAAVIKALQSGKLSGFVADVLEVEASPKNVSKFTPSQKKMWALQKKLANLPNVLLTPHTAHATVESDERLFTHTFETILAFQKGKKISCVN